MRKKCLTICNCIWQSKFVDQSQLKGFEQLWASVGVNWSWSDHLKRKSVFLFHLIGLCHHIFCWQENGRCFGLTKKKLQCRLFQKLNFAHNVAKKCLVSASAFLTLLCSTHLSFCKRWLIFKPNIQFLVPTCVFNLILNVKTILQTHSTLSERNSLREALFCFHLIIQRNRKHKKSLPKPIIWKNRHVAIHACGTIWTMRNHLTAKFSVLKSVSFQNQFQKVVSIVQIQSFLCKSSKTGLKWKHRSKPVLALETSTKKNWFCPTRFFALQFLSTVSKKIGRNRSWKPVSLFNESGLNKW